jgi:hypothetical protein
VRKLVLMLAVAVATADALAVTVVLKGGRKIDAAGYDVGGSYVVVQYADGRRESYPLSSVDFAATSAASGEKAAPGPVKPSGPHSPFLDARSGAGGSGVSVTDADVKHSEVPTPAVPGEEAKPAEPDTGSQVSLVSYEKKQVAEGQWEITITVANQGKNPVTGVTVAVRALDARGLPTGMTSGTVPGRLDPGKQGTATARLASDQDPVQLAFDLNWQEVRPPAPKPSPALGNTGWNVPAGSPPNTFPENLMAPPSVSVGVAQQVPRPAPQQP